MGNLCIKTNLIICEECKIKITVTNDNNDNICDVCRHVKNINNYSLNNDDIYDNNLINNKNTNEINDNINSSDNNTKYKCTRITINVNQKLNIFIK